MMLPDDPLGTVRAGAGLVAVRCHSSEPDDADDLIWLIVNVAAHDVDLDVTKAHLAQLPIVYQAITPKTT